MGDPVDTVRALVMPLAAAAGVDVVDVEVKGTGARRLVRVRIDRKGGVDLAACHRLSGALSAALDDADPFADRYALEVTSPGVDHPLEGQRAFDRVEGRGVLVRRAAADGDVVDVRGTVRTAGPEQVVLDVDGDEVAIPYQAIVHATQALPW